MILIALGHCSAVHILTSRTAYSHIHIVLVCDDPTNLKGQRHNIVQSGMLSIPAG